MDKMKIEQQMRDSWENVWQYPNWDEEYTKRPVARETLENAIKLLHMLPDSAVMPTIYPESEEDSIEFYWGKQNYRDGLYLSVYEDGRVWQWQPRTDECYWDISEGLSETAKQWFGLNNYE